MSDPSNALAQLLGRHADADVVSDAFCSCGITYPEHTDGYAAHLAEVIAAEFLAVPRGDIIGMEYGYRFKGDEYVAPSAAQRERAIRFAARSGATAVERPILAYTPIPAEAVPDA